jgi:hypothetical protein
MSIVEFYHSLVQQDWFSCWSDAPQVYWAGEVSNESLHETALINGPSFSWVLAEYKRRVFSGKPWGTEPLLMLNVPVEPSLYAMIDLRADYERMAFASFGASAEPILERARYMGALAHDESEIPRLVRSVPALREAWAMGQKEAIDLHKSLSLRPRRMTSLLAAQKASQDRADAAAVVDAENDCDEDWWSV